MKTLYIIGWLGLAVTYVEAWTTTLQRDKDLCSRYEKRFGLDFSLRAGKPCAEKLRLLTELHLEKVPFDNLRLHGAANSPVSMDSSALAHQLIDRRRGGLCFELNGLFAELLLELGYRVSFVPATMKSSVDGESIPHLTLLVEDYKGNTWLTDVGMGEAPLHPLAFVMDKAQETPEGMKSRLRKEDKDTIALDWYRPETNAWETRFTFSLVEARDSPNSNPRAFESQLMEVLDVDSCFRRKPVACKLTRHEKITLAGNTLKLSQQRFHPETKEIKYEMQTVEEIRHVLQDIFDIPLEETMGLTILSAEKIAWT